MNYIEVSYFSLGILISVFLIAFTISLFRENQYIGAVKILLSLSAFVILWSAPIMFFSSEVLLFFNFSVTVVFLLLFFFPVGKPKGINILDISEQVDERDTMFARAELLRGTDNYEKYYDIHPEKKEIDDKIRSTTKLLAPGGKYYKKEISEYVNLLFKIEESRISETDGEVSKEIQNFDPHKASKLVKNICKKLGGSEVGIALLNQNYVYSHQARGTKPWGRKIENNHKFVIVFSVEMDFDKVAKAPNIYITEETAKKYLLAQNISINLAKFIRNKGFSARAHISGSNYEIMLPPVAYDAGLGELGRMNYLISKKHGGRIRLGAVTTDMPLVIDKPVNFGVQDFCDNCMKCAVNCPSGSITKNTKTCVRGVEKWDFHVEQCYSYWRYLGTDCGICMKVCPFSHKNNLVHNIIRYAISKSSFARKLAIIGDDFVYGRKLF